MTWEYATDEMHAVRDRMLSLPVITGGGATATATVVGGVITAIAVTAGGTGYSADVPPTVLIGGPGRGARALATVVAGAVTAITVATGGSGYDDSVPVEIVGLGQDAADIHYPSVDLRDAAIALPCWALFENEDQEIERHAPGESFGQGSCVALGFFAADLPIGVVEQALADFCYQVVEHTTTGLFVVKAQRTRASKVRRRARAAAGDSGGRAYKTGAVTLWWEG